MATHLARELDELLDGLDALAVEMGDTAAAYARTLRRSPPPVDVLKVIVDALRAQSEEAPVEIVDLSPSSSGELAGQRHG